MEKLPPPAVTPFLQSSMVKVEMAWKARSGLFVRFGRGFLSCEYGYAAVEIYEECVLAYDYRVLLKSFNSARRQQDRVARRVVRPPTYPDENFSCSHMGCTALPQA